MYIQFCHFQPNCGYIHIDQHIDFGIVYFDTHVNRSQKSSIARRSGIKHRAGSKIKSNEAENPNISSITHIVNDFISRSTTINPKASAVELVFDRVCYHAKYWLSCE